MKNKKLFMYFAYKTNENYLNNLIFDKLQTN